MHSFHPLFVGTTNTKFEPWCYKTAARALDMLPQFDINRSIPDIKLEFQTKLGAVCMRAFLHDKTKTRSCSTAVYAALTPNWPACSFTQGVPLSLAYQATSCSQAACGRITGHLSRSTCTCQSERPLVCFASSPALGSIFPSATLGLDGLY